MQFPCEFPIKIIGKNTPLFFEEIKDIVRKHYPTTVDDAICSQASHQNNYLAITATVTALDKTTLDALYLELTNHPAVKMVL